MHYDPISGRSKFPACRQNNDNPRNFRVFACFPDVPYGRGGFSGGGDQGAGGYLEGEGEHERRGVFRALGARGGFPAGGARDDPNLSGCRQVCVEDILAGEAGSRLAGSGGRFSCRCGCFGDSRFGVGPDGIAVPGICRPGWRLVVLPVVQIARLCMVQSATKTGDPEVRCAHCRSDGVRFSDIAGILNGATGYPGCPGPCHGATAVLRQFTQGDVLLSISLYASQHDGAFHGIFGPIPLSSRHHPDVTGLVRDGHGKLGRAPLSLTDPKGSSQIRP